MNESEELDDAGNMVFKQKFQVQRVPKCYSFEGFLFADGTAPNERQKTANMKLIDHIKSHKKNIHEVRLECWKVIVVIMGQALAQRCNLFRNDPIGCMDDLRDSYSNANMEPLQVGQAFVNSLI